MVALLFHQSLNLQREPTIHEPAANHHMHCVFEQHLPETI